MQDLKLSATSYIVLGLLDAFPDQELTPYDIKQRLAVSVDNFWPTPHAQVYREPERLAAAGYVTERREDTGRRRRFYAITKRGRAAVEAWRHEAPDDLPELRDAGVLKLFFEAHPGTVAEHQLTVHRAKLAEYEALRAEVHPVLPAGQLRALDFGIAFEQAIIGLWEGVGEG
ncbi:MAG: PadR family transcriptional regulator [Conexibacter sp.]|nr:PadR family transcriptional regulator [Conexibacter sp.]